MSAHDGDIAAIDCYLRIAAMRANLLGLGENKAGAVNLNISGNPAGLKAETHGIEVRFIRPKPQPDEEETHRLVDRSMHSPALIDLQPDGRDWSKPPKINVGLAHEMVLGLEAIASNGRDLNFYNSEKEKLVSSVQGRDTRQGAG